MSRLVNFWGNEVSGSPNNKTRARVYVCVCATEKQKNFGIEGSTREMESTNLYAEMDGSHTYMCERGIFMHTNAHCLLSADVSACLLLTSHTKTSSVITESQSYTMSKTQRKKAKEEERDARARAIARERDVEHYSNECGFENKINMLSSCLNGFCEERISLVAREVVNGTCHVVGSGEMC